MIAPCDGTTPDALMKNADLALYRCKAKGGNTYRFFEAKMGARIFTDISSLDRKEKTVA